MITFKQKGNFDKTVKFLGIIYRKEFLEHLDSYAQEGVAALQDATPVDTGESRDSWGYEIIRNPNSIKIIWTNDNMAGTVPVVILLQYGHATRNGTFVQGVDFINPAMTPIFEKIADNIWKEVVDA